MQFTQANLRPVLTRMRKSDDWEIKPLLSGDIIIKYGMNMCINLR